MDSLTCEATPRALTEQLAALRRSFFAEQERAALFFNESLERVKQIEIDAAGGASAHQFGNQENAPKISVSLHERLPGMPNEATDVEAFAVDSVVPVVDPETVSPSPSIYTCKTPQDDNVSLKNHNNSAKVVLSEDRLCAQGGKNLLHPEAKAQGHGQEKKWVHAVPVSSASFGVFRQPSKQSNASYVNSSLRKSVMQARLIADEKNMAQANRMSKQISSSFPSSVSFPSFVDASHMFENSEDMKKRVQHDILDEELGELDCYTDQGWWQAIAKSTTFEVVTHVAIVANAIWIAVDTDYNDADVLIRALPVFQIGEHFFCAFFVGELVIRFMAYRVKREVIQNKWFMLDSLLVFLMVLEVWILTLVALLVTQGSGAEFKGLAVIRVFRLLRVARTARLLRLLPEQMVLISGLGSAIRTVFSVLSLIVLVTYVLSILVTQIAEGTQVKDKYFKSVAYSMQTMLRNWVLEDHHYIIKKVAKEDAICTIILVIFVVLGALTAMHMLIGVLAHSVLQLAEREVEKADVKRVKAAVVQVLVQLDMNQSGGISIHEMEGMATNKIALCALRDVHVNPEALIYYSQEYYLEKTTMSYEEVCELCLELREEQPSRVKHMLEMRKFLAEEFRKVENQIRETELKRNMHAH